MDLCKTRSDRKRLLWLFAIIGLVFLSSCSRKIGWGVVLWPPEDSALDAGATVPVLFKSNINKTYAVALPGTKLREELEIWRVDLYSNAGKAREAAEKYALLAPVIGITTRDGLLLRETPDNLALSVYRLRLDQDIKLLEEVKGARITTADRELEGSWFLALAEDGTRGYVFSNQLILWNYLKEERPSQKTGQRSMDSHEAELFDRTWRPDYFTTMMEIERIDLAAFQARYGVFADMQRKQIRIERPGFSKVYKFNSIIKEDDGSFNLEPSGASFSFTNNGELHFYPPASDLAPGPGGEPAFLVFIEQNFEIREIIAQEEQRRLRLLAELVQAGESFYSYFAGNLVITRTARVTWTDKEELVPLYIPEDALDTGSISMDLFLSDELAAFWDGAFTIRFDGETYPAVRFAYRYTDDSLSLAFIDRQYVESSTVNVQDGLIIDLYFER